MLRENSLVGSLAVDQPSPTDTDALRAYFAAAALQGLLGAHGARTHVFDNPHVLANRAFELADAMMAARSPRR